MNPKLLALIITALPLTVPVARPEPLDPPHRPLRDRLEQLNPEERAKLEQRLDKEWAELPLHAKLRALRIARALRDLPPEDRRLFHERIERFLNMSPEERERLRRNRERWEQMTPEQRERAREEFRKRRDEFRREFERHEGEPRPHRPPPSPLPPPPPDEPLD
ncbi:MAG: DUF3106 domain-containing protein [Verrucomicrobiae bacterium]|nr:DUF3106 domain-containing protein [Verrucomicrobiae bacterium]